MWSDGPRRDVPSAERREDRRGTRGRERHRPPRRLTCPHGGPSARRLCHAHGPVPAERGQACEGDDTRLTGTGGAKTRPRPARRVLRRRGMPQGAPPARLARALGLAAPLRRGRRATTAGPTTAPCGPGVYSRRMAARSGPLPSPATGTHGRPAWAREEPGAGPREGHGHTGAGAGAARRAYWRACRGGHRRDGPLAGATADARGQATRGTPARMRRMGRGAPAMLSGDT
jgi:hypothetical protein